MEYLLVMTLSGSTMTIGYLILRRLLWNRVSAGTFYLLTKAAVLYYLLPLPFVKTWYREALRGFLPKRENKVSMAAQLPLSWMKYAVHAEGKLYVNIFAWIEMAVIVIWVTGAGVLFVKRAAEYLRNARRFAGYAEMQMTDRHREVLADLKARYGVKRRVALYPGKEGEPTMTFGVIRPVIICSKEPGSREAQLLLRHELVHIKRLDVLWKILLQFASLIHWWNPILWKLCREFERACECSCDEAAMSGRPAEEIKAYLRLLVEEATEKKGTKKAVPRWKAGFGDNAQKIKERMENLMMGKKRNRFAAGALVAVLTLANSMTVFAYRDTVHVEVVEEASQEEITRAVGASAVEFIFDEADAETIQEFEALEQPVDEILYDKQFTDEEGTIYPAEDAGVEPYHDHDFGTGTFSEHYILSNGGCEVRSYDGQRCKICGYIIRGALKSIYTYVTCPH